MNVAVSITATERPHYFSPVLWSWRHAYRSASTPFHFQVEPIDDNVLEMCNKFKRVRPQTTITVNPERYGALGNPYYALQSSFEQGFDFVILGEDDSVVSHDVLDYFQWAAEEYHNDESIFTVCSFNHIRNGSPEEVYRRPWFASVIWGVWKETWYNEISPEWGDSYIKPWDKRFVENLGERDCIYPCLSRSQHIGEFGTHMFPEMFHKLQADDYYTGSSRFNFKETANV